MKSIDMPSGYIRVGLIGLVLSGLLFATQVGRGQTPAVPMPVPGTVISGEDIGFRFESVNKADVGTSTVTGKLMVRIGGQWLPAELSGSAGVKPLVER
jgi:hypothetical protein